MNFFIYLFGQKNHRSRSLWPQVAGGGVRIVATEII